MKKSIFAHSGISLLLLGTFAMQSCNKNFEEINTNPDASPTIVPEFVFSKAQYDGVARSVNFLLGTMQYTTSYNDVAGFGSKYVASQIGQTYTAFTNAYPNEINEIGMVIRATQDDAEKINLFAQARIWRVYCFSRLTDLYGDIPYFQAGLGYEESIYKPEYDSQEEIYADMLQELEEAAAQLDASLPNAGGSDLVYNGDPAKWKKFAYSLMLRLSMRMTGADAAAAQTWATKAIAGGVILDDGDIAKMNYVGSGQDINKNPLALDLWNNDYIAQNGNTNTEGGKYQQVFIDHLKANEDPRLGIIAVVYNNGVPDTAAAIQKGMPSTISNVKPADFVTYSEPNPKTVLLLNSPRLLFTAAESYFLLSEAALRGWYAESTAAALYENGIRAALRQWSVISGAAGEIPTGKTDAYVNAHQLNTAGSFDEQMEQIYTEFWVGLFPDAQEVYASYRRTGFPALVPNNYPGNATGGQIFRRLLYPLTEQNLNGESYNAAITRQGPDDLMTRVWWDKP